MADTSKRDCTYTIYGKSLQRLHLKTLRRSVKIKEEVLAIRPQIMTAKSHKTTAFKEQQEHLRGYSKQPQPFHDGGELWDGWPRAWKHSVKPWPRFA